MSGLRDASPLNGEPEIPPTASSEHPEKVPEETPPVGTPSGAAPECPLESLPEFRTGHVFSNRGASDGLRCELVSWTRCSALARRLATEIRRSGFYPDIIVAIARGGYLPARLLSDYLEIFDLASVKIEHYHGVRRERRASVRYPLTADIQGRQVLLVDDVSDSGITFEVAVAHLRDKGTPAMLKTAVLHHKRISNFIPDYFAEEVAEWRWIIYPWAVIEDLGSFLRGMRQPPASIEAFDTYLQRHHGLRVNRQLLEDVLRFAAH